MKSWPAWRPGMELKAEHLLGLEDFLLARSNLLEERAHGLDFFDRESSLAVRTDGETTQVEATTLRGVTPGGHPVMLDPEERILAALPEGEPGTPPVFDASIELNHPDFPGKLALLLAPASEGGAPPEAKSRRLDLGRFRLDPGGALQLVRRPPVRRLEAIRPMDEAWQSWVRPFASRLEALLKELEHEGMSDKLPMFTLAVEAHRLAFEWPSLSVPALVRRLHLMSWLRTPAQDRAPLADYLGAAARFVDEAVSGEELPERLAEFLAAYEEKGLTEAQRRLTPEDVVCVWVDRFWEAKFLRPISGGTVELHVPNQANPPPNISLQNRELTYVRSVEGKQQGGVMVYPLGALPVKAGSVYRFRMHQIVPSKLVDAEFRFIQED
jgi:hypothetical protein